MDPAEGGGSAAGIVGLKLTIREDEWDRKLRLGFEREMLGLYVSSHPLAGAERILRANSEQQITQLEDEMPDGAMVTIAGILTNISKRMTKQGKMWASAVLEDLDAGVEVLFFSNTDDLLSDRIAEDLVVAVKGRINRRDGGMAVAVMDMGILEVSDADLAKNPPIVLYLTPDKVTASFTEKLRQIADTHPGDNPLHVVLKPRSGPESRWDLTVRVAASQPFLSELKTLVGPGAIA